MSTQVFNGINGFALKPFSQKYDNTNNVTEFASRNENAVASEEWFQITKEKNKLPTATLCSYVLYYRNNGDLMTSNAPGTDTPVQSGENYRFYNDLTSTLINTSGQVPSWTVNNINTNGTPTVSISASTTSGDGTGATFAIGINGSTVTIKVDNPGNGYASGDTITFKAQDYIWLQTDITITVGSTQVQICNGRQLGWIWGFPLFDVSGGSGSWPRFESCYSSVAGDNSGNQIMLVDISDKQNLITVDMSKFQFNTGGNNYGDGFDDISNNITGITDSFYMNLRIKSSAEKSISYAGNSGQGINGNWNPMPRNNNTRDGKKWCTLVKYEFYCDVVGPKSFLNFSPTLFSFIVPNTESRFLQAFDNNKTSYITTSVETNDINTYTDFSTLKIKTGLGQDNGKMKYSMSPGNAVVGLGLSVNINAGIHHNFRVKEAWYYNTGNGYRSYTFIKLIGGWYHTGWSGSSNNLNEGYYGSIVSSGGNRQTKYNQTISWKNDIELKNTGSSNKWSATDSGSKNFDLNNILWCSLKSPRKIKVNYIGSNSNLIGRYRFITNFIDLKTEFNNESIGGGYANNTNVLDLPRKSHKPYFSKMDTLGVNVINTNTVSIKEFNINTDLNYLDASSNNNGNELTLTDINYYNIYFKLLIPPQGSDEYSIKYDFGKSLGCVTTFFRYTDMSGNPTPSGNNNKEAIRDSESITLTWSKDSVNELTGDISINTITLFDIASGSSNISSTISSINFLQDASYNEIYDISTNVFQLHFFNKDNNGIVNSDRDELPYTMKTFDTATSVTEPNYQYIDISYVPQAYQPYRYLNIPLVDNTSLSNETLFFDAVSFPEQPVLFIEEKVLYNPSKLFTKEVNNIRNANIIEPSGNDVFGTVEIDISGDVIYDNSYSVLPSILTNTEIQNNAGQEIAVFDKQSNQLIFTNSQYSFSLSNKVKDENGGFVTTKFIEPSSLKLENYLIPDYWRLPDKLNTLRSGADDGIITTTADNYSYYDDWIKQIQTTMVFDLLSITLKAANAPIDGAQVSHILINTNKSAIDTDEYSAITDGGVLLINGVNNLVYEVQGAFGIPTSDYLNLKPIVLVLKSTFDGPFGTIGQNYIGNRTTGVGGINSPYPANNGLPKNDDFFIVNTILLNKMRKGNNSIDGTNLAGTNTAYNGIFNIDAVADGTGINQNPSYEGTIVSPSPLITLLVDISSAVQLNPSQDAMINDENNKITLEWSGFDFSVDPSWNLINSDIYWTVTRYNIQSGRTTVLLNEERIKYSIDKYVFNDITPVIYSKYRYSVSGVFKWTGIVNYIQTTEIPSLNVTGFVTNDILVCKNNRFPYGRYNSTSTNLKLYRPLLLNTPQGQEYPIGNKVAGGVCDDGNGNGLLRSGSIISSSNNIYANTTNQVSKKQTYVILSKSRFRPFR